MPVVAVLGAHWGDEGKGKIAAALSASAEACARFQGGPNAGHTLHTSEGEICLRMVPSGVLSGAVGVIGGGCVIDLRMLLDEVHALRRWVSDIDRRLVVSTRAHVILDEHRTEDRSGSGIGSTKMGVGPTYRDKMARRGVRVADVLRGTDLPRASVGLAREFREVLGDACDDDGRYLRRILDRGARVIAEGAQGSRLDIDHGDYPYVTSSNTTVGAVLTGLGLGPRDIESVLVATPAYVTKVGGGSLPSRVAPDVERILRERGREVDGATGLTRDVGWLDLGWLREACRVNQADGIVLTKLDVLADLPEVGVYDERSDPKLTTVPGWTRKAVEEADRSGPLGDFIDHVERSASCPVVAVGRGPGTDEWWALRPDAARLGVPTGVRVSDRQRSDTASPSVVRAGGRG